MSTGTTANFTLTRNEIIASAMRKIKAWPEDGNAPVHKVREAVRALNNIVRAEDLKQTGLAKSMWALSTVAVPIIAGRYIYGKDEGLPAFKELIAATLRGTNGDDGPLLDIISAEAYAALSPKDETGEHTKIYVKRARLISDQKLYLWPAPLSTSVSSGNSVVVKEVTYTCIQGHTSSSENKPGVGASWSIYWKAGDVTIGSADTWVTATDYVNGNLLLLTIRRPLYDFDGPFDNPDFPLGWEDYLIYKLAVRLAPEYDLGAEQRQQLKQDLGQIEAEMFPSTREVTTTRHNKSLYY